MRSAVWGRSRHQSPYVAPSQDARPGTMQPAQQAAASKQPPAGTEPAEGVVAAPPAQAATSLWP